MGWPVPDDGLTKEQRFRQNNPERIAEIRREHRDRAKANPKANSETDWYMRRKFGMTLDDYNQMLADQGGGCAVCGTEPGTKRLHIDHDHETLKVRGLLCHPCNVALGFVKDDVDILAGLMAYLMASKNNLTGVTSSDTLIEGVTP